MQSADSKQLIHRFLEESAKTHPDKCAMIHGDIRLSYAALNNQANRCALWLISQGLSSGDRVALLLENCQEYLISYYGVLKAGGVVVPLNPELKPDGLGKLLAEISPRFIIASARCERTFKSLDLSAIASTAPAIAIVNPGFSWADAPTPVIPFEEILRTGDACNPVIHLDEANLASIIFTSGSTGRPKGVMLSHGNIAANTHSIVKYLGLTHRDIQMVVLPFFYVMGKSLLNTHIAAGGTVVLNNRFAYPASVIQQMVDERVTGFSGVPSTYAYLLHRSPLKEFRDKLESLRYCSQAGGHLARHTKEELLKVLPVHTEMYVMYGATEAAARLTYVEPGRIREKIDSIGIPIPGVTIKVLDKRGRELPRGQVGELVTSGPNIMLGYWRAPDITASVLSPNGYHTGDLGYQDEDGYFYIVGRKDAQLKVGGHRIDPKEVEDALIATGLIIEAAVFGLEDALAGHRLAALVVTIDPDTTDRDILHQCSLLLPRHKLPTEIRIARTLPKHHSGKIAREACADYFKKPDQSRSGGI